ncbi:MAG TPA: hypothetical protein VHC69_13310 [Polyangiaceae bacterium]|nr:hypothetical protein [Polyangiaceae bacterium]
MKDPARLLDEGPTPAELWLLKAGASEEPSVQAVERLAGALGLASGAALGVASTKSAAAGSVARGVASKIAAKWVVFGALGVLSGAAVVLGRSSARPGAARAVHGAAPAVVDPRASASAEAPVTPGIATEAPANTNTESVAPPRAAQSPSPSRARSASIAKEIAELDVARRALSSGDAAGALAALNDYDKSVNAGMLRQEAALLRIEALARAGNEPAAKHLANRFLREHPRSPHERRIRALVGESP